MTPEERIFLEFTAALADWLEPYHDYIRPPAATVLAEAVKLTELKIGHPLKGLELPALQGTNGNAKKDEEPPSIKEPPSIVSRFFNGDSVVRYSAKC